ncbi:hypothetical protein [Actinokineospora globicatena]|uniref:hypothetical protein n=1 Tax=Actinokineospora globicatena TaxID=103729 RepID=UPI0020A46DE2|nr:hypothetical protein [Actinokineospora globicatena]MCP2303130.1 hypothetical protein [Actinokineospora globicatena]GLW79756.1 hypothetical protein Aglo01_42370 [Actinokineospora globicatena]GLW85834.1 hypothetical protein Aglo02_34740 [Actinokineospora globicatena]
MVVVTAVVAAVAIGVAVTLIANSPATPRGPRPLTTDEANRLAVTRFLNYQAGGRAVTITVPTTSGGLVITGSVDYRAHLGYGVVRGTGRDTSSDGLIQWNSTAVFVHPMTDSLAEPPVTPPGSGWHQRPLTTSGSSLDSALLITLGLGNDRPDNAELLPQNGATWVRDDQVRGRRVDVMAGPAARAKPDTAGNVRYWVDSDSTLHRVEADVASEPQPVVIDLNARPYVPVQPAPGVTP